ncbi:MAG: tRNA (guanosine(37)-N1)-methyltransferase TrmD [Pseudomonadota bacterium]
MTKKSDPTASHNHASVSKTPTVRGWQAQVLTAFPASFPGALGVGLAHSAREAGLWSLTVHDLRDFACDPRGTIDDRPFGGGAGMVLLADVVDRAIIAVRAKGCADPAQYPLWVLSPRGERFSHAHAQALIAKPGVILLCGRYEGIDQRVIDAHGGREVSLGDFVLSGGEVAAQAMIESAVRLLPGVLGNADSLREESFTLPGLEYPSYTRPARWRGSDGIERAVPAVLRSGDHGAIARWRATQARALTSARRPDLFEGPSPAPARGAAVDKKTGQS